MFYSVKLRCTKYTSKKRLPQNTLTVSVAENVTFLSGKRV